MSVEKFGIHLHDSGIQHVLSSPEHEAIRITATPDSGTWPTPNGFYLQGSYDNVTWESALFVGSTLSGFYQTSPYLHLRVVGDGAGPPDNAAVTIEYLTERVAAYPAPPTVTTTTITNDPLTVSGSLSTTSDLSQQAQLLDVLADILNELKIHTEILEEMQA